MNNVVTVDLSKFGHREIKIAIELLKAYIEQSPEFFEDNLQLCFNTHSGYVFLSDSEYIVGKRNCAGVHSIRGDLRECLAGGAGIDGGHPETRADAGGFGGDAP